MRKKIKNARRLARKAKAERRTFECGHTIAERSEYFKLVKKGKVDHARH